MFYSSGTTGRPKGVVRPLTGRTIDDNPGGKMAANFLGMDPGAVYLSTAPLYHTAALGFAAATQALGGTCVLMERFDAEEALRAVEVYGVTHTQWVPTMFKRLLSLPLEVRDRYDLSSHRVALHGAAPCPVELKHQIIGWWGPSVLEYYGATEGNGMTVIDSDEWLAHVGSVGKPVFGAIHICDEDGGPVPTGEDGLVYFERDRLPFAYHKDDAKTSSTRHPEHPLWTTLGDVGHVDEDGYLYLTDRQEFLIISGGVNIYPAESELLLLSHPLVADVADVAERRPRLVHRVRRRAGLLRVVVVLEGPRRLLEVDDAVLARGQLGAFVVAHVQGPEDRLADRAGVRQPVVGGGVGDAVALGGAVVLVDDRAPPLEHLVLHRHRAGSGGVDGDTVRRQVVSRAHLLGQLEHAHEHGRDPLAVGDGVALDGGDGLGSVEVLHAHDGAALHLRAHRIGQRGGVVQRCRRQIHGVGVEAEEQGEHVHQRHGRVG